MFIFNKWFLGKYRQQKWFQTEAIEAKKSTMLLLKIELFRITMMQKERGRAVQVDTGEVEKHRSQRTCYTRVSGLLPGGQNNAFECCEASGRHGQNCSFQGSLGAFPSMQPINSNLCSQSADLEITSLTNQSCWCLPSLLLPTSIAICDFYSGK